jgi:hypothetical protein
MRLIEVMGAEARKWKQGKNQQSRSKVGKDRRGPTMHACTMQRRGEFYRVCVLRVLRVFVADSMNAVDSIDLIAT